MTSALKTFTAFCATSLLSVALRGQDAPKPVLVDEIAGPDCEMLWSRLDAFSQDVGKNPTAIGQVEISPDFDKPPHVNFYWYRMIQGYALYRGIPHDRWEVRRVAPREPRIRFWLVPPGAPRPEVEEAEWPFIYPADTKPFMFTNGENYSVSGNGTCLPVDEYRLLAEALDANPKARVNVVLITPTEKVYQRRRAKTLRFLIRDYSIAASRIRFFRKVGNPKPGYPDPDAEYWFVP